MSYSPTLGRWAETDPATYIDGPNLYEFVKDDPERYVDPSGLDATTAPTTMPTTRPTPGPTVGPVTSTTGPGTRFQLIYRGPRPTFYQTIEVSALPCCKIPDKAALKEAAEHGGNDPTTRPVGDNPTGDPNKPYGGAIIYSSGGATMIDAPNFDDPSYPDGFQGQKKGHIKVVCQGKVVAEFDFVTTATARNGGNTVLTPGPTTIPTTQP